MSICMGTSTVEGINHVYPFEVNCKKIYCRFVPKKKSYTDTHLVRLICVMFQEKL